MTDSPYKIDDNVSEANWVHLLDKAKRAERGKKPLPPLVLKFSPDEPRDEHGRWSGDGSGSEYSNPEKFTMRSDAGHFISSQYEGWQRGLPEVQARAFEEYQSVRFEQMNGLLRGNMTDKSLKEDGFTPDVIDQFKLCNRELNAAIAKAPPLKKPLLVYRGLSAAQFGELKPGMVVQDKGFVSTTLVEGDSGAFNTHGKQATAAITLPKGFRAGGTHYLELILPAGSKFRVVSVDKSGMEDKLVLEALNG